MPLPIPTDPVAGTPDYSRAQSWALVNAKYTDAGNWCAWGADLMSGYMTSASNLLGSDTVEADLAALIAELDVITASNPGTISGAGEGFSDDLLTSLKSRLSNDIVTYSTGLGSAEADMFARAVTRENDILVESYNQITTNFSSRGFDMPPGAMNALVAQENSKSVVRLTDVNTAIMEESARIAVQYNLGIVSASTQLIDMLSKVYESEELRKFEASKATVMLAVENYKSYLGLTSTKAEIAIKKTQVILENKSRQLALEVQTMISLAQGAQQIVASSLNGVTSSANFNWSADAHTSYQGT